MGRNNSGLLDLSLDMARKIYVESPTPVSLEECAERTGCALSTVQKTARVDKWSLQREKFLTTIVDQMAEDLMPDIREKVRKLYDMQLETQRVVLTKVHEFVDSERFQITTALDASRLLSEFNKSLETLSRLATPETVQNPKKSLQSPNGEGVLVGLVGLMYNPPATVEMARTIDMGDDDDASR